jgi:hypothetical protein
MNKYSFSSKPSDDDSEVVAVVDKKSKELAGIKIYLNMKEPDGKDGINNKIDLFYEWAKHKQIKQKDYDQLIDAIEYSEPPADRKLSLLYNEFKNSLKRTSEILLKNSTIEVAPLIGHATDDKKTRECILVSGKNGSGKSYWTGAYLEKWHKLFPQSPMWLISNKPLEDEPAYRKIRKLKQIPVTKESLSEIIGDYKENDMNDDGKYAPYQYFKSNKTTESLILFDDFEGSQLEKEIRIIMNSVLTVGRSSRIYCIVITHELCSGKKSKLLLGEVNAFCLFNEGISNYALKYMMRNYTKMNDQQITKVIDANSPWVFIRSIPNYVVEKHKLWLY